MRRFLLILPFLLVASGCTGGGSGDTIPATTTTTAVPPATSAPTLPDTTTTTSSGSGTEPLTQQDLSAERIGLMPLDALPAGWGGWRLRSVAAETNGDLVRIRIQDPRDAASDLVDFSRQDGARSVFAPATATPPAIDTWVEVFDTDAGAAGYLTDFVRDVVKGLETAAVSERRVAGSSSFEVNGLGAGAIGLVLEEAEPGTDVVTVIETVVGFRIGRILGFVSVQRDTQQDDTAAASRLATVLDERIRDVLAGRITVPEPPPPPDPDLKTYAWTYSETLLQTIIEIESEAGVEITGVVETPDLIDCTVDTLLPAPAKRYVIAGEDVWRIGAGGSATPIADPSSDLFAADLAYCPPWPVFTASLTIDFTGGITEEFGGRDAIRHELSLDDLVQVGALPEGLGPVTVETATMWVDAADPWLLGFDMAVTGTGDDFVVLLGPDSSADPEGLVRASLSYRTERINDETLMVTPPG
jgi:hypothetical protein